MPEHQLMGQLSGLHEMTVQLLQSLPEPECHRSPHPLLAPLAWYLGRGVYLETHWIREIVQGDDDLTARVREIFTPDALPPEERWARLPPRDHLLNWALELQDENIMRLANPGLLPLHPLLAQDRLLHILIRAWAETYEQMMQVMVEWRLRQEEEYRAGRILAPGGHGTDLAGVSQGHYRIGAMDDPAAADNELPPQVVELSSFRIDRYPVSNAAYLAFMTSDGYTERRFWSDEGWRWRQERSHHPHHWRSDIEGNWYAVGVNGPYDLPAEEPVMGLSRHEAGAYANWVADQGGELSGAVLQHEYQWEVAARTHAFKGFGRAWEWCANIFSPYTEYQPPEYPAARTTGFDGSRFTLKGASLHTPPALRRASYRNGALPGDNCRFSGLRLVFPPRNEAG